MESPFKNDPFTVVAQAFSNLYPDKRYMAHVAAGNTEESHGTEWETAFEAIFNEYERIGKNLFSQQEEHKSVLDDC